MLKKFIFFILMIFASANIFAEVNFVDPVTVTGDGGTPNLSDDGQSADYPQIATDSTGKYVYAVWFRYNNSNFIIQTAISSDYSVNWSNPTTVTGDGGTPNLSDDGRNAFYPQIATDSTGKYVYAVWERRNDGSNGIIQTAISSDYGTTWINPTTVTGDGGTPNLSDDGYGASSAQVTTDSTGRYVYAIWSRSDGSNAIVQTAISSDYGVTWSNPTAVTGDGGTPNLSDNGQNATSPRITTDSTGRYVYAIWVRTNDGIYDIVQTAFSADYGVTWSNPTTVTGDGGTPNLSDNDQSSYYANIATDSTGRYVYAIWVRTNDGIYDIVQTAFSADYGVTWSNPTAVTGDGGTPNLSDNDQSSSYANIATDSTGRYIYAIWVRANDGTNYIVQTAISSDYGITWSNPTTVTGDGGVPNLSDDGRNASDSKIVSNSTGRYIYATWTRANDGTNYIVQTAFSADYGITWENPATVTGDGGVPNLSDDGKEALYSQITTDSTGRNIYVIWRRSDESSNPIVQVADGSLLFPFVFTNLQFLK